MLRFPVLFRNAFLTKTLAVCLLACSGMLGGGRAAQAELASRDKAVRIILDSDMSSDVDDVGALALLHALADRGEAEILATGISDRDRWAPYTVQAINAYFGRPHLPVGSTRDLDAYHTTWSKYTEQVAKRFSCAHCSDLTWGAAGRWKPDAVRVYRRVLAKQPDNSVILVSIGSVTNFYNLLQSGPNEASDLTGRELIDRKVKHWVCMGGTFAEDVKDRSEANIYMHTQAARVAFAEWPGPITFSPLSIGRRIKTGKALQELPESSPVRMAYKLHKDGFENHSSFDQAAVFYAVRGLNNGLASDYWTLSPHGTVAAYGQGMTSFTEDPDGQHRYQVKTHDPEKVAAEIDALMLHTPPVLPDAGEDRVVRAPQSLTKKELVLSAEGTTVEESVGEVEYSWISHQNNRYRGKEVPLTDFPAYTSYKLHVRVPETGKVYTDCLTVQVQTPYPGAQPTSVPGILQAEHFDSGGPGVGYHDATTGNAGRNSMRTDPHDVDLAFDRHEDGRDVYVGWIREGEWLAYTVTVEATGEYRLSARVARKSAGNSRLSLRLVGEEKTAMLEVPSTGGWSTWQTVSGERLQLSKGTHVLQLHFDSGNFNIDWFRLDKVDE